MKIELSSDEVESIIKAHIEKLFPMPEGQQIISIVSRGAYGETAVNIGIPRERRAPKATLEWSAPEEKPAEPPSVTPVPLNAAGEEIF